MAVSKVEFLDLERTGAANKTPDYSNIIMGIDLGTTNSAVAVYNAGNVPTLVPMGVGGKYTLQSCIRWDGGDKFTVGQEAYEERYKPNVVYSVKRLMGSGSVVRFVRKSGNGNDEFIEITPAQASAEILKALKHHVNLSFPGVRKCIITVPAYFNQRQIEDTVEAAKLADLECIQILKEPTSASYIYSMLGYARDGSVLVYDLGGGTFDVTHMNFMRKDTVPKTLLTSLKRQYKIEPDFDSDSDAPYFCRVLGTYGDTKLGGDDIDIDTAKEALKDSGNPKLTEEEFEKLVLRCEQFKKNTYEGVDIQIGAHQIKLQKQHVHRAIKKTFEKTMELLEQISPDELRKVKTVVLVGGSTKSDYLVELLETTFPEKEVSRVLDPDATVALGAGAVAKALQNGKEAAYQDVLPMPIGVLVDETDVEVCIQKNTAMPYSASKTYYTLHDNQQSISLHLYQGVSKNPKECTHLGLLRVTDIPMKPAGEVAVKISFLLSAQGRLTVVADVDGVEQKCELVVESIFSVSNTADDTPVDFICSLLTRDEFEKSIADLVSAIEDSSVQGKVLNLLDCRRDMLDSGEDTADIEMQILDLL